MKPNPPLEAYIAQMRLEDRKPKRQPVGHGYNTSKDGRVIFRPFVRKP